MVTWTAFAILAMFFIYFLTRTMYIEDYSGVWTSIRERDPGPGDCLPLSLFHQELGQ